MSLVARQRGHRVTYYVVVTWQSRRVWERAGADRREAERLEKRRVAEVAAGTYAPPRLRGMTLGRHAEAWMSGRSGRNADNERAVVEQHVLTREWLTGMRLEAVRSAHIRQLVAELQTTVSEATGKPLSPKYVSNIFGLVRTMFRDALRDEMIDRDPCELPRRTLVRGSGKPRKPYAMASVRQLLTSAEATMPARVFAALALLTGMREGEVCGRRWSDWDRDAQPLGCLTVDSQYEGRPLKTVRDGEERPRKVPVHPALATILEAWWSGGFEAHYLRRPKATDFIVPHETGGNHTRSSAYKLWRRACVAAGIDNLSLHSTRHTFISMCRRGGAPKDVLERITHNAKGDIVDQYTHRDWSELCEAVLALQIVDAIVDADADDTVDLGGGAGNRTVRSRAREPQLPGVTGSSPPAEAAEEPPGPRKTRTKPRIVARVNGRRRIARSVQQYVADRLLEALPAAKKGDREGTLAPLAKAARVLAGKRRAS